MAQIKYLISNEQDILWGTATTTIGMQEGLPGVPYPYGEHPPGYMFSTEKGRKGRKTQERKKLWFKWQVIGM